MGLEVTLPASPLKQNGHPRGALRRNGRPRGQRPSDKSWRESVLAAVSSAARRGELKCRLLLLDADGTSNYLREQKGSRQIVHVKRRHRQLTNVFNKWRTSGIERGYASTTVNLRVILLFIEFLCITNGMMKLSMI